MDAGELTDNDSDATFSPYTSLQEISKGDDVSSKSKSAPRILDNLRIWVKTGPFLFDSTELLENPGRSAGIALKTSPIERYAFS